MMEQFGAHFGESQRAGATSQGAVKERYCGDFLDAVAVSDMAKSLSRI